MESKLANQYTKTLSEAPSTIGGHGPRSYYQNSSLQKGVADAAKGKIREGIINKLDLKTPNVQSLNPFRIADLGCSVGPNTFFAVDNIIEAVNLKYGSNSHRLEFQVFFNDVTGNDFNTLFRSIPSPRKYFAAGVPGSFHGRLFPNSSLLIAHSCYALPWLSKVPEEVVDRNSAAWNKDSICCIGTRKEVGEAFAGQYKKDMDGFLSARAEEIVEGGLLIILTAVCPDGVLLSQTGLGLFYQLLGSCLLDLAKLGVINEEKAETFNLPVYHTSPKEMEEIIKSNGCFTIEEIEAVNHSTLQTEKASPEVWVFRFRASLEGLFKKHFGNEDQVDQIFHHFHKKITDNYSLIDGLRHRQIEFDLDLLILLKRNSINPIKAC